MFIYIYIHRRPHSFPGLTLLWARPYSRAKPCSWAQPCYPGIKSGHRHLIKFLQAAAVEPGREGLEDNDKLERGHKY